MKILIIEDNAKTANALRCGLRGEGFEALASRTGAGSADRRAIGDFDLVVLDWMLPGVEEIEILAITAYDLKRRHRRRVMDLKRERRSLALWRDLVARIA